MRTAFFTLGMLILLAASALGQSDSTGVMQAGSLDLTVGETGLSFGNGQRLNGVRFAWRDGDFETVNGLNVSFWKPYDDPRGEVNGISFGIVGPGAGKMRGITLALGAAFASESMAGIHLAGLGLVSQGAMTGINIAGLGTVAQGDMTGINIAGLGTVSQGSATGVNIATLGLVSQGDMMGINVSGLGTVSQGGILGFNFGGLGLVGQGSIIGFNIAGLGLVSQEEVLGLSIAGLGLVSKSGIHGISVAGLGLVGQKGISGLNIGGVGIVTQNEIAGVSATLGQIKAGDAIMGITFGGYKLEAPSISGINLGVGWTESLELTGLTCAGYNQTDGLQTGLVVGVVNYTRDLLGVQIGLLNYVEENPAGLKLLPILNAKFR
jgi:hypothetical protein